VLGNKPPATVGQVRTGADGSFTLNSTQLRRRACTCGPKSDRRVGDSLATAENFAVDCIRTSRVSYPREHAAGQ
jgi:hypothetical protein